MLLGKVRMLTVCATAIWGCAVVLQCVVAVCCCRTSDTCVAGEGVHVYVECCCCSV